jgi:very-short-patch-repair endonuclease
VRPSRPERDFAKNAQPEVPLVKGDGLARNDMTEVFNKHQMKERRQELRRNMTEPENIFWSRIRRIQIDGIRFRRQYSIDNFVVDFYCPEFKLAIEVDGESHNKPDAKEYDAEREDIIKQHGITFLRFANTEIIHNLDDVLTKIQYALQNMKSASAQTFPLVEGKTQKGSETRRKIE